MAEAQPVFLQIPPSGLEDLMAIADHAQHLDQIISKVETAHLIDLDSICQSISKEIAIPRAVLRDVLDGLAMLHSLAERMGIEDTIAAVASSIETQIPFLKPEQAQKWQNAQSAVVSALNRIKPDSPIALHQKIRQLTYAHQNNITDLRLITDIRPVYNSNADKILAAVLTHVLSITYHDGSGPHRIDFAMDADDIAKLRKAVERAQLKTATARAETKNNGLQLVVAGASNQGAE